MGYVYSEAQKARSKAYGAQWSKFLNSQKNKARHLANIRYGLDVRQMRSDQAFTHYPSQKGRRLGEMGDLSQLMPVNPNRVPVHDDTKTLDEVEKWKESTGTSKSQWKPRLQTVKPTTTSASSTTSAA